MTLREELLKASPVRLVQLEVPEWNRSVWLRTWSVAERMKLITLARKAEEDEQTGNRLVCMAVAVSVCDEDGKRVFLDGDLEALSTKDSIVLDRIVTEAYYHNKIAQRPGEEQKNE